MKLLGVSLTLCVVLTLSQARPSMTPNLPGLMEEENNEICPDGWSMFGKRCFIFIDAPKTWTAAEFYCQFEGAHLASVHSSEEYRFIQFELKQLFYCQKLKPT
uniref:C-type lectin domain-containing protein n=1 Tax=Kryptolebias marmoratus TaxID=37003 RepID=A0A3Q3AU32_KRYMA